MLELKLKKGSGFELDGLTLNPLGLVAKAPPKQIEGKCLDWSGHKYFISDKPMNFTEAQRFAAQLQGRMLAISSLEEEEEVFIKKQGRGLVLWMPGWRHHGGNVWRDENNRPVAFFGRWAQFNPQLTYAETQLSIFASPTSKWAGWNDHPATDALHACIEWGEE